MKVNCGMGPMTEASFYLNWHRVFAWWPIRVGENDCRWLETVERQYRWRGASGTFYDPSFRPLVPAQSEQTQ
jgi:hypothetical protein